MSVNKLIAQRRSIRRYLDKPVEREKVLECLEAARLAPSASNSQPWKLIIVDESGLKNRVANATFSAFAQFNKFAPQAPVLVVLTLEKPPLLTQIGGRIKDREYSLIDIGIAAEHFCLQAAELGLGTCILGWFDERKIKKLLHIPRNTRVGLIITLGYAAEDYQLRTKKRKPIEAITSYNIYDLYE